MNTADVKAALRKHYCGDGSGEEWVLLFEARAGAGFSGNSSQCDLIALHTRESRGLRIVGHEIKVSRGDWLKELKKPEKADYWWRICHEWHVVVPKPASDIVKPGELPVGWGLIEVNDKARTVTRSTRETPPKTPPWPMIVGWFTQIDRLDKRDMREALLAEYRRGEDVGRKLGHVDNDAGRHAALNDEVRARAAEMKAATGIDLFDQSTYQLDDFKRMFALARRHGGLSGLLQQIDAMRNNAANVVAAIETLTTQAEPLRIPR